MLYQALANLVACLHGLFIVALLITVGFIVLGRTRRAWWVEVLFTAIVLLSGLYFWAFRSCPLTDLELFFRYHTDPTSVYRTGCVSHYLGKVGIPVSDRFVLQMGAALFTLAILTALSRRLRIWLRRAQMGDAG